MALADYFDRSAMAAGQVLQGQDPAALRAKLEDITVGLFFGGDASSTTEGRALLDMLTRLVARLYPKIVFSKDTEATPLVDELAELALKINPRIEIARSTSADIDVITGGDVKFAGKRSIFCGSDGWRALVSSTSPQPLGDSPNPFGAGAAACLAAANVFRSTFLSPGDWFPDQNLEFSTWQSSLDRPANTSWSEIDIGEAVLAGVGAIGMASVWALARLRLQGLLHLVDPQSVELSNLQRYVLCGMEDIAAEKVAIANQFLAGKARALPHLQNWQDFAAGEAVPLRTVLVALDTAADRAGCSGLPSGMDSECVDADR